MDTIQTVMLPIGRVVENRGQIPGVPGNPRKISISKMRKLMQSIREYPGMIQLRELLVYPVGGKYVLIGGNMRRRALRELGYREVPCKVLPVETSPEELNAYILRDNSHYGEWDFDILNSGFSFGEVELANIQVPKVEYNPSATVTQELKQAGEQPETAEVHGMQRKGRPSPYKNHGDESRCDLVSRPSIHFRSEFASLSTFRKTETGTPLSDIKQDENVELFAQSAFDLCKSVLKFRSSDGWALVTTPFRRHKEGNFSDKVYCRLASLLGIPYLQGYAEAKNRDRINPIFTPQFEILQPNVILYDDIATTFSTLRAMHDLMGKKNVLTVIGINNN